MTRALHQITETRVLAIFASADRGTSKGKTIDLVIFDCDGVLVDSELITNRVFAKMINELGVHLTLEDMFERFVGRSMAYSSNLIASMLKRPIPDDFVEQYRIRTTAALHAELEPVPGIESVLNELNARGVPFCVASSGSHEKMRTTLGITGLLSRFEDRLFSATEVANGKPAPDVFLFAAKKAGVAPSRCYVVEDTPAGVMAGVSAGMTVFEYCALTPAHRLIEAGAHCAISEMSSLPRVWFGGMHPEVAKIL
jgi:HAD superfamily hydrolase (TIGR01509 family)